eukprot:338871_1
MSRSTSLSEEKPVFDVAVVGGGVMGCSVAWAATQRGLSVCLCEQFEIGHSRGSSHGDGRIFRKAQQDTTHIRMMERVLQLWEKLERQSEMKLHAYCGSLIIGPQDDTFYKSVRQTYDDSYLKYDELNPEQLTERFPQISLPDNVFAMYQKDAGIVYADRPFKLFQLSHGGMVLTFWRTQKFG